MRAKRSPRLVPKWGKAVVNEPLDLCKRNLKRKSVDPIRVRSLSSLAYAKAIPIAQGRPFFAAGAGVIEVDLAYTSVSGAVNHTRRHGISSRESAACSVGLEKIGSLRTPVGARGGSGPPAPAILSLSPCPQAIRRSMCGRFCGWVRKRLKAA